MQSRALIFVLLGVVVASRDVSKVTPVAKVINLLTRLQKQVMAEGQEEAASYDKYACFCKQQMDDKQHAIEASDAAIKKLDARIQELGADIGALVIEIGDKQTYIDGESDSIKKLTAQNKKEHEAYLAKAALMDQAISAVGRAIKELKASKARLKKANLNPNSLVEIRSLAGSFLAAGIELSDRDMGNLALVSGEPGTPHAYEYQSNDVIAVLESLLVTFKEKKQQQDNDEIARDNMLDKQILVHENNKKFAEQEILKKKTEHDDKSEEQADKTAARDQEINDMNADKSFLGVLTSDCEKKADTWDQRSLTRTQELTAIHQAITALKEGVKPNWQANKKLVDLQRHKTTYLQETEFLQVKRESTEPVRKVAAYLRQEANRIHSPTLMLMSLKSGQDHFVKVRGLIKDLVERLKEDAKRDATQKGYCDKEIGEGVKSRDAETLNLEEASALTDKAESEIKEIKENIARLSGEIAKLQEALDEATKLRSEEKAENEKTLKEAEDGKAAVDIAITVLNKFYEGAAGFVQFVPKDSDRDGNTVADLAPDTFTGNYEGKQKEATGIIGMLDVIKTDFERTITDTTAAEDDAQKEFDKFEKDTNIEIKRKQGEIDTLEDNEHSWEGQLNKATDDATSAGKTLKLAKKQLADAKEGCVDLEDWKSRAAKRKEEIEALKQALAILEDWKK